MDEVPKKGRRGVAKPGTVDRRKHARPAKPRVKGQPKTPLIVSKDPLDQPLLPGGGITERMWRQFLRLYKRSRNRLASAKGAGFTASALRNYLHRDDELGERLRADMAEAEEHFLAELEATALELSIEGEKVPLTNPRTGEFVYLTDPITRELVLGADGKPQIAFIVKRNERLIQFLLRAMSPKYRDKAEVNHNVRGGVLVVPASPTDVEDWEARYGDKCTGPKTIEHQ